MTLNRKARRVQAKTKQKHKPVEQFAAFLMQSNGRELTEWQQHDLNWFAENPGCNYHLREILPGEYEPPEVPPPDNWLSLVKISCTTGVTGISRVEQCPLAPEPANGFDYLMAMQKTPKGQEALRVIWNDYPQEVFHA
ncbi:hypothetical protein F3E67_12420 [Salmonella enterica subsp. salamae]|nr:hypothetical protein [Salmonella enterica subsp. salamae]